MWDATVPATPAMFSLGTLTPLFTTVTERTDLAISPPGGIGYARVYDVEPVPGSAWQTNRDTGFSVSLNYDDPAYTGTPNYNNLWICPPSEWSLVGGQVVLDRSDK